LYWDYRSDSNTGLGFLVTAVAALSAREFYALCRVKGIEAASVAGAVAAAAYFVPVWLIEKVGWGPLHGYHIARGVLWLILLVSLYALLKLVFRHGRFTVEGAAATLLGFFYVSLIWLLFFFPDLPGRAEWFYLVFLVAANKGSDMAAYVVGKSVGKHKMTPVLSPNKTWEGCVGGAIGGTAAGAAVLLATPLREGYSAVPVPALLLFAFVVTMAAQVGDLVESAFKRWAGVKDSGRLLPEFGGMLDMVDSFLISVPVAYLANEALMRVYR
jgi:phosphatidate cytidylyltransferase